MRYSIFAAGLMGLAMLIPSPVRAGDSVIINNLKFTCTNTCVITGGLEKNTIQIKDCCGGIVSISIVQA